MDDFAEGLVDGVLMSGSGPAIVVLLIALLVTWYFGWWPF
jgi:hypothetical protein